LAEAAWLAAWDADPQSDEALYNLAVASEARHDFVAAERYLHAALERNSSGLYAAGLQRLKENGPHHHLAVSQRQQRGEMGQRLATQGSSAPRISTAQSHVTPPVEAAPVSAAAPVEGTPLGVDVYVTPR
jgi:hypothetical protein